MTLFGNGHLRELLDSISQKPMQHVGFQCVWVVLTANIGNKKISWVVWAGKLKRKEEKPATVLEAISD